MELPSLDQIGLYAAALGMGAALALSFHAQLKLQRIAVAGDPKGSLFNRVTMAGLSMAILFGAVVLSKAFPTAISYMNFMLTVFAGAAAMFVARLRSNSTVKRDARKNGARPLP
jgi:hypothetical protein